VVIAALGSLVLLAWAYLAWLSFATGVQTRGMSGMPGMMDMAMDAAGPQGSAWSLTELLFAFAMWSVMMVAMMAPAAAPMILLYARVGRHAAVQQKPFAPASWFATGYLLVWAMIALAASVLQLALVQAALLTPMLAAANNILAAAILILAGLYQWTALKRACLSQCRSPFAFVQQYGGFRGDVRGALLLGMRHGAFCAGCCWALMALLFVAGVMNLLWIAALTLLVMLEKLGPRGEWVARGSGLVLIAAGLIFLAKQAVI
jgi:predicted metal-binding membrane protein